MCARFTVLSDTPIASAIAGCAMPFSRNSTIRMPRRCFSGIFQCNAVFSCRIWRLVHLTICSPESDSQGITLTPQRFGTSLPQPPIQSALEVVSYALTDAMDDGHCGLPRDELMPAAETLLEVPLELVRTALDFELAESPVIADSVGETPCVFLTGLHRTERIIAKRLHRLTNGPLPWPWIDPDKALPWVAQRVGLVLAESQAIAITLALVSKVLVITGGSRRWQNHHRQSHSAHSRRKRCPAP